MAENDYITQFLDALKWISPILPILGAIIENKYHIINRIRRRWAILFNKGTIAQMALEYKTDTDFQKIIEIFKNAFRGEKGFNVKKITQLNMAFTYDIFSVNLINEKTGNIFIEVERMGSGIKDLKEKINDFLAKLSELSKKEKIFVNFVSCDFAFSLPYKWEDFSLYTPRDFEIKEYSISFIDKKYKSEIKIYLNQVNVKTDAREAITQIIEKFV